MEKVILQFKKSDWNRNSYEVFALRVLPERPQFGSGYAKTLLGKVYRWTTSTTWDARMVTGVLLCKFKSREEAGRCLVTNPEWAVVECDRDKITKAFKALKKLGYATRTNFECCRTCAWAKLEAEGVADRAVHWCQQDEAGAFDNARNIEDRIYISWSGDGKEICAELERAGLKWEWNGSQDTRIKILRSV